MRKRDLAIYYQIYQLSLGYCQKSLAPKIQLYNGKLFYSWNTIQLGSPVPAVHEWSQPNLFDFWAQKGPSSPTSKELHPWLIWFLISTWKSLNLSHDSRIVKCTGTSQTRGDFQLPLRLLKHFYVIPNEVSTYQICSKIQPRQLEKNNYFSF